MRFNYHICDNAVLYNRGYVWNTPRCGFYRIVFFNPRSDPTSPLRQTLVEATRTVYSAAVTTFLPTPAKSHYVFNLRDLARVVRGVLLVPAAQLPDAAKLVRLWVHEAYRVFCDRLVEDRDRSVERSVHRGSRRMAAGYRVLCPEADHGCLWHAYCELRI